MEITQTKILRFPGAPCKFENAYKLEWDLQPKDKLFQLVESRADFLMTKHPIVFSAGILAHVSHSIIVRIWRYTKPEMKVGVFIELNPKVGTRVDILGVKGSFDIDYSQQDNRLTHPNETFQFEVVTNAEMPDTKYLCYKPNISDSAWEWPPFATKLHLTIRIGKVNYSAILSQDKILNGGHQEEDLKMIKINAQSFYMSENCSDVQIKVDSTLFPAHKVLLAARSEYFARMFSSPMRESEVGLVEIKDDEVSLVKELLSFIYLGVVENLEKNANSLFLLADKYVIPDLSTYCEKYLLSILSVENAMEMFDLSHTVGWKGTLAQKSKEIILWNKEKFAPNLDTFKGFFLKYPELIFELLQI